MKNETSADDALQKMQSNYSTYKLIEMKLTQSKASLKNKLPDIQRALEMVQYLASQVRTYPARTFLTLTPGK